MGHHLKVYNSLSRQKEVFTPMHEGKVGMYVCGPTVYSDVHLGNCRTFVSFDLIYRYLCKIGYKVRYVRNITDVGHLVNDVDTGEDKIAKRAKLEQLEPMELVQKYTNGFHHIMDILNTHKPNIEPTATGHIIEQIEMVQQIIDNGFAYEKNGSVYFDTLKFSEQKGVYGDLSGRKIDELLAESRELQNQGEKNHPSDFAIWMKASSEHIMKWPSPWSEGFPGWHLECSAMSTKYLGKQFDIHGGGNDLKFPHHENEVAQNVGACGCTPAKYWLHTNMLLMNGRKMSKSDGNTITPQQLFTGDSDHVTQAYSPMTIRFFMLQAHYRSTLDISDDALLAADKGFKKLMEAGKSLSKLSTTNSGSGSLDQAIHSLMDQAYANMDDDFNSPKAIATWFEIVSKINGLSNGTIDKNEISTDCLNRLQKEYDFFINDIFGLGGQESASDNSADTMDGLMSLLLDLRADARTNKDYATSDKIRDSLAALNIVVKDGKEGTSWNIN